jgi:hypothetical protein
MNPTQLPCSAGRRSFALIALVAILLAATPARLLPQTFPSFPDMHDFSDAMVEQPDTTMVVEPGVPADAPYTEEAVTADPSYTPPPMPPPGTPLTSDYEGPVGVTGKVSSILRSGVFPK